MSRIYRPQHNFARECVPKNVIKILDKLVAGGFEAYLVGGSVRDILLGLEPKDFDIATSAHPPQVRKLFRNCRLIGRRFRLAHIYFGREIIEVATFRGSADGGQHDSDTHALSSSGQIMRDNIYGTLEQDAKRRDFTVNALYYNWHEDAVLDYHNGVPDIRQRHIKLIGAAEERYKEDPVRMLRAVRFAVKLDFTIEQETEARIFKMSNLLANIPPARLFEEFLKMFQYGFALAVFLELEKHGLLKYLFPQTSVALLEDNGNFRDFIMTALGDTDKRIAEHARTTPAYLIAVLLWAPVQKYMLECKDEPPSLCMHEAAQKALRLQRQSMSMPKRFAQMAKNIWEMQPRLKRTRGKSPFKVLEHPKFRVAYDFLLLRHRAGEPELERISKWWTEFQFAPIKKRRSLAGFSNKKSRKPG